MTQGNNERTEDHEDPSLWQVKSLTKTNQVKGCVKTHKLSKKAKNTQRKNREIQSWKTQILLTK